MEIDLCLVRKSKKKYRYLHTLFSVLKSYLTQLTLVLIQVESIKIVDNDLSLWNAHKKRTNNKLGINSLFEMKDENNSMIKDLFLKFVKKK